MQIFFSSERPEVHEKDADSFMAFIKRWLFGVHFVVDVFAQFERFMGRQVWRCIQARESGIFLKLRDEWLGICRNYAKSQMLLGHKMLLHDR